ncbi:hypothetical protein [Aquamicrobium defluvii]|uniref:hypothetical protein n=1 Tax=Aquamicrobium defluvii TaxID=69279 RepID=UPI000568EDEE|nr:hypothetical protein [Aquamicrobium defluvii]
MNKLTMHLIAAATLVCAASSANAAPERGLQNLGGVNLNHYCSQVYGSRFKSALIGRTAGDWICEQSNMNRRPISVEHACKLQYKTSRLKAKALNWNDPTSWRCFKKAVVRDHRAQPEVRNHRASTVRDHR